MRRDNADDNSHIYQMPILKTRIKNWYGYDFHTRFQTTLPSNINEFGISLTDLLRGEHAHVFLLYFISFTKYLNTEK